MIKEISILQLRLSAYDSSSPAEKVYTEMVINVNRNEYGPAFAEERYEKVVLANAALGTEVMKVTATDRDVVCIITFSQWI